MRGKVYINNKKNSRCFGTKPLHRERFQRFALSRLLYNTYVKAKRVLGFLIFIVFNSNKPCSARNSIKVILV